jgi:hypothetical protein
MNSDRKTEKQAELIAVAIVELVERIDGPVTLAQIDREIIGFAKSESPSWAYAIEHSGGDAIIWDGMTEAGLLALRKVISGRRVAVQPLANLLPYLLEGGYPRCEDWMPVVLLPVRAANLDTPNWRMRGSQQLLDRCMRAGTPGYRLLTPGAIRCTADRFAV